MSAVRKGEVQATGQRRHAYEGAALDNLPHGRGREVFSNGD
jgi:hypothetical protein